MHSNGKEKKKKTCTCYAARSISKMDLGMLFYFQLVRAAFNQRVSRPVFRSCHCLPRLQGWWHIAWNGFDERRFKANFCVTKATFLYIFGEIEDLLTKETICEEPVPPMARLAVCPYRLARGDYLHTVGELVGLGASTVGGIVHEVCETIINRLRRPFVGKNMPTTLEKLKDTMASFDELWQFPCAFGAVDGCHLPITCPKGGLESAKEYHNFKNFYSIVILAIVDAKYRFTWASSGYPGNSHDAIIFQSTDLFCKIVDESYIPAYFKKDGEVNIYPCLLGDSAFPFLPWLMKPYSNAVITKEQRYFTYRLSRARLVAEGAFGQLKGRWRILLRKCECQTHTLKLMSLACVTLHNICIDLDDKGLRAWDLTFNEETQRQHARAVVRNMLCMTSCRKFPDSLKKACQIRDHLKTKFWNEQLGQGVS